MFSLIDERKKESEKERKKVGKKIKLLRKHERKKLWLKRLSFIYEVDQIDQKYKFSDLSHFQFTTQVFFSFYEKKQETHNRPGGTTHQNFHSNIDSFPILFDQTMGQNQISWSY